MNCYVHYRLTKTWAIDEGYSEEDAELVARANVEVDNEYPGRRWANKRYHLRWFGASRIARRRLAEAISKQDLDLLGKALHGEQDAISHGHIGHVLHWPGIDIWERRSQRVRARIEMATREMLRGYAAGRRV